MAKGKHRGTNFEVAKQEADRITKGNKRVEKTLDELKGDKGNKPDGASRDHKK